MSTFITPSHQKNTKDKFLFCFNPYPLDELKGKEKIAIDGYLTQDDAKVLLEAWGVETLKKCFRDTDRTITDKIGKNPITYWPFYGVVLTEPHKRNKGKSLYSELKSRKLI